MNSGRIITFYSYKGGVGRSFALANIAAVLARWGAKVLCVDWDLEAPGLHHFFPDITGKPKKHGLLQLLESVSSNPPQPSDASAVNSTHKPFKTLAWKKCVNTMLIGATGKTLDLVVAGRDANDYVRRVHALDWQALYEHHALGEFLERLRQEWARDYDFVLLDSRTGLTDIGGICTIHLPNVVVPVFTANQQNMEGTAFMAKRINEQRRDFFFSSGSAIIMPLLSRWEEKDAPEDAQLWWPRILDVLRPSYNTWRNPNVPVERLVELLKVPYKAKWNFGERLAVLEESSTDPGSVSYHLHLIAALLALDFSQTDILVKAPGDYVARANDKVASLRITNKPPRNRANTGVTLDSLMEAATTGGIKPDFAYRAEVDKPGPYEDLLLRKLTMMEKRSAAQSEVSAIVKEINQLRRASGRPILKSPSNKSASTATSKANRSK